jgi:hypothetical protein
MFVEKARRFGEFITMQAALYKALKQEIRKSHSNSVGVFSSQSLANTIFIYPLFPICIQLRELQ